jgi:hypothetical protein
VKPVLSILAALTLCLLAAAALAQPVIEMSLACEGDQVVVRVSMLLVPPEAGGLEVVREVTVGDCGGAVLLTPEFVAPPANWGYLEQQISDPGLTTNQLGQYVLYYHDEHGNRQEVDRVWHTCGEPIVARGRLLTTYAFEPCAGVCLLECTSVDIAFVDDLQYVGTGEIVELRGWPAVYNGPDDCSVAIADVVPLGAGATCADSSPAQAASWGAVKSLYR